MKRSILYLTAAAILMIAAVPYTKDDSRKITTFTVNGVNFDMVFVQEGTFTMGCTDDEECSEREHPAHQVTLSSFNIAKYPVTQKLWEAIMGNNPSTQNYRLVHGYDYSNRPVETVSWHDVQEFITRLNAITGKTFRLPTEAEWEYAARGGTKSQGYKYSGSNDIDAVAWYAYNSNSYTHNVGLKAANELGIYDMSGNVGEWCSDWFGYYSNLPQLNPQGPDTGFYRVIRNCHVGLDAPCHQIVSRSYNPPTVRSQTTGFRLALSYE